jgi:2-haloacid dehalogenase
LKKLIAFDVNETLLDLAALDPHFERVFGSSMVRNVWFATLLRNSLVATITGRYDDFGKLAGASLDMTAAQQKIQLGDDDRKAILTTVRSLPAHSDVVPGLEKLKGAGFRLVTLTNSPPQVVEAQLQNSKLTSFFEKSLSVDAVKLFKPAAQVYLMAGKELGVAAENIRLVAAHDWDVAGALNAGCKAAFISRPGKVLSPLMPTPDIIGPDLVDVAGKIVAADSG